MRRMRNGGKIDEIADIHGVFIVRTLKIIAADGNGKALQASID